MGKACFDKTEIQWNKQNKMTFSEGLPFQWQGKSLDIITLKFASVTQNQEVQNKL